MLYMLLIEVCNNEMKFRHLANVDEFSTDTVRLDLTTRESEILQCVYTGLSNKEIGKHLNISSHTVKHHISNIFNKLSVSNRAQAIATALSRGMIKLDEKAV